MGLPKSFKKNIDLSIKRRNLNYPENGNMSSGAAENMKDAIVDKNTYLPKGVLHIDLDTGFKNFISNDLDLTLKGVKVPVLMMSIQKWGEFSKTWQFLDEFKNIKIPFIIIVRRPDTQQGTNPSLIYNIPNKSTYTYSIIPTWDGNRKGADIYKIPQPTPVDIFYDVKLITYRQNELNSFNLKVLKTFQSSQAYTKVNGHYIPIELEDISDESKIDTLDKKRFYVQNYEFNLQGFILDPDDFEVTPAINRIFKIIEVSK